MKNLIIFKKINIFPEINLFKKINDFLWLMKLNSIIKIIRKIPNLLIITDVENEAILKEKGFNVKTFDEYSKKEIFEKFFEKIKKIYSKWRSNQNIQDLINYKGYDLMYINETFFLFNNLSKKIEELETIKNILSLKQFDNFYVLNKQDLFYKYLATLGVQKIDYLFKLNLFRDISSLLMNKSIWLRFYNLWFFEKNEFVKSKKKKHNSKKILFSVKDNIDYDRINSILKEIKKSSKKITCLSLYKDTQKKLKEEKVEYCSPGDYLKKSFLRSKKKDLKKRWEKIKSIKEPVFIYKKINVFDIFEEDLKDLFYNSFLILELYIDSLIQFFNEEKIKSAIVLDDSVPFERILVLEAKKHNVPTIRIQNGIEPAVMGFESFLSDKKLFWGEVSYNYSIKKGVSKKRCLITGATRYDEIYKKRNKPNKELFKKWGLAKNKKIILVATQAFDEIYAEKEKERKLICLFETLKRLKNYQMIIKPHPREKTGLHYKMIQKYNLENIKIIKEENIIDLINISDIFITTNSTTILEAIMLNKPTISLNLLRRKEIIPFVKNRVAEGVYKEKDLFKMIKKIDEDKGFMNKRFKQNKKFIQEFCFKFDGNASKRASETILSIDN